MDALTLDAREAALDFDGWLANRPAPMRDAIDGHLSGAPDREAEKKRLAASLWISEQTGVSPYDVDRNFDSMRAGIGERMEWDNDWQDNDKFHARIVKEATKERDEKWLVEGKEDDAAAAGSSLIGMARAAAFEGRPWAEALQGWSESNKSSNGYSLERVGEYSRIARETYEGLAGDLGAARPAADAAWAAMEAGDDAAALAAFKPLSADQRALATHLIQKRGEASQGEETGLGEATGKTLARASDRLFLGSGRSARLGDLLNARGRFAEGSLVQAGSASAMDEIEGERIAVALARSSAGGGGAGFARAVGEKRALTADEAAAWNAEIDSEIDDVEISEELRGLAQSSVDPIQGGSWVRRKIWQPAVESLPTMLAASVPGAWAPVVETASRAYAMDEYTRLRAEGIEQGEAMRLGAISGGAQGALDVMGYKWLQKFAPRSVRELARWKVAPKSATARAVGLFAAGAAGETAVEQVQDHLIPAAVDDFISNDPRLDRNWGQVWKEVATTAPDVFLGMLLPTAFFAAAGARGDMRAARELMGANAVGLRVAGYSPEAAAEIVAAKSPEAVRDLLNKNAPLEAPTPEKRAEVVEQIVDEMMAARDAAAVEAEATRAALAADNISLTRRAGKWIVSDGKNEVEAATGPDAVQIAASMSDSVMDYDAAQVDQLVTNMEAVEALDASQPAGMKSETVLYPQKLVTVLDKAAEGGGTAEAILERQRIFDAQHGLAPGESAGMIVLGENVGAMNEGIYEDVSKVNAGGTVLDVFEERIEGRMKAALERGIMTREEAAGVLAAVEAATGDRYVTGETDADLIEGVSSLLRAELYRRRKGDGRESLAPAGLVTRSLTAAARAQSGAARTGAGKALSFIRAARTYLGELIKRAWALKKARAEGKIGEDVDAFIGKLTGVGEQAGHNKAVMKAVGVTVDQLATSPVKAKRNIDLAGFRARVKAEAAAAESNESIAEKIGGITHLAPVITPSIADFRAGVPDARVRLEVALRDTFDRPDGGEGAYPGDAAFIRFVDEMEGQIRRALGITQPAAADPADLWEDSRAAEEPADPAAVREAERLVQGFLDFHAVPPAKQEVAKPALAAVGIGLPPAAAAPVRVGFERAPMAEVQKEREAAAKAWFGATLATATEEQQAAARAMLEKGPVSSLLHKFVKRTIPSFDIRGATVGSPRDFHQLALAARSPFFESVKIAVLDENNVVIGSQIVNVGSINESTADVRAFVAIVVRMAEEHKGSKVRGFILSHNHPSGIVRPSTADQELTARLRKAAANAGVPLLDHVVTNGKDYYSFVESGLLDSDGIKVTVKKNRGKADLPEAPPVLDGALAQWETVSRDMLPAAGDTFSFPQAAKVTQTADPDHLHLYYLNNQLKLMAVERVEPKDAIQTATRGVGREGALWVLLSLPAGKKFGDYNQLLKDLRKAGHDGAFRFGDAMEFSSAWVGRSAKEIGLMEPGAEFGPAAVNEGESPGRRVVRITDRDGRGLMNNEALNRDKLTDDEDSDLTDLMDFGLEQPRNVPAGAVFYFTEDGFAKNKDLVRLLKKASRRGYVETWVTVDGAPLWETEDGQIAVTPEQVRPESAGPAAVNEGDPSEYGMAHRPMNDEGGAARLHDLVPAFGEDVYGSNALQFFGSGDARERETLRILAAVRGKPDAPVTIFRGVPASAPGTINAGDWVTLSRSVAEDFAELSGGGQVLEMTVKASEVTSWADSLLEFGYWPAGSNPPAAGNQSTFSIGPAVQVAAGFPAPLREFPKGPGNKWAERTAWIEDKKRFRADVQAWAEKQPMNRPLVFRRGLDDWRTTVVTPDATEPGKWRATRFDTSQEPPLPMGHSITETRAEAVAEAVGTDGMAVENVTFSIGSADMLENVAGVVQSRALPPAARRKMFEAAREELRGMAAAMRHNDALDGNLDSRIAIERERIARQEAREEILLGEIEERTGGILNQPELAQAQGGALVSFFLRKQPGSKFYRGTILSRSAAKKAGRNFSGEYDGAAGLPAWLFGGHRGPDLAVDDAVEANLLPPGATVDDLWDALRKELAGAERNRQVMRKVRDEVKEARKVARDEARAWAKEQLDKLPAVQKMTAQRDMLRGLVALDAILARFPVEVRARVGGFIRMASLATNVGRETFLKNRVARLDVELERFLRKEYSAQLMRLIDRSKLKKGGPDRPGEKPIGRLGADVHTLMEAVERAMVMDSAAKIADIARLDSLIGGGTLTPEQETLAMRERELVNLVGDWSNLEASSRATAVAAVEDTVENGWLEWQKRLVERREMRERIRGALMLDVAMIGSQKERRERAERDLGWKGQVKEWALSLSSFEEVVSYTFGLNSVQGQAMVMAERKAAFQYEDAVQAMGNRVQDFFTKLAGGSVLEGEKLRFRLSQPSVVTEKDFGTLSELEAIQAILMWRQEDGQRHMMEFRINQPWMVAVEKQLSDQGRAVLNFISGIYAAEHAPLNALYRERHGVNLPKHDNYAPLTVKPVQAKAGEIVDPVSGGAITGNLLTPGPLRTRSRIAKAEPQFRDALQTMLAHNKQMEHWKAYYDFAVDSNAVLGNRNLGNSVTAKAGAEAESVLRKWIDLFASGGHRDAAAGLAGNRSLNRIGGRFARMALVGRVGTLVIQSTQLAAALAEMPTGAYVSRFGRLFAGQLGWGDAIRSNFIRRRYEQAPPIVRQAMEGLTSEEPNAIKYAAGRLGNLLSGADALFTAGTYAILLDYHRGTGQALGLTGPALDAHAHREAERATERVAQPTRLGTRSLYENTTTNPLARLSWSFASEARQKIALAAWAAHSGRQDPARAARVAAVVWGAGGLMATIIRSAWRDMRDDEDEELFDEKNWGLARLVTGTLGGPLYGVPMLGEAIESTIAKVAGAYMPDGGPMDSLPRAVPAVWRLASFEFTESDQPVEDVIRDVEAVIMAAGLFNETAASAASLAHPVRDAVALIKNLLP